MDKIYIIGIATTGKSSLAGYLSSQLQIPRYMLDDIVWERNPKGDRKRTEQEQQSLLLEIDQNPQWIIEGTYRKSCHCLLEMADVILVMQTPLWKRRMRMLSRFLKYNAKLERHRPNIQILKNMHQWTREFEHNKESFYRTFQPYWKKVKVVSDIKQLDAWLKRERIWEHT